MKIVLVVVVLVTCFAVDNCQVTPAQPEYFACVSNLTSGMPAFGPCFANTTVSSRILHATQVFESTLLIMQP